MSTDNSVARLRTRASVAAGQLHRWKRAYRRRVLAVDALVLLATGAAAEALTVLLGGSSETWWSAGMAVTWLLVLTAVRSRDLSLAGVGAEEYRRVLFATVLTLGATAVGDVALRTMISRTHLTLTLVLGVVGLFAGRHLLRKDLRRRRGGGDYVTRVLILGTLEAARSICESFARRPDAGYQVAGLCVPDFDGEIGQEVLLPSGVVPVLGDDTTVKAALKESGADALAVAATEHLGHENMRRLAWRMQSMNTDLLVVPGVTDVAGHRLRMLPIDNLPLLQIDAPPLHDGASMHAKRVLDLLLGGVGLLAALPVIALAALAIRLDDGGPVFFVQQRIGLGGKRFGIVKLRTMKRDDEPAPAPEEYGVFNKKAVDARITRVGGFLRATSIDELPQLFNVIGGAMSLVGPRPLVAGEAGSVEHFLARRALVKPGMTGLWQVSGRSDVTDEERVRLDHSYVDNWSVAQDLMIIWRTVRAVVKRDGAY